MGLTENAAAGVGTVSCRRADGGAKPLAVVFDVDETVILNEGYEFFLATGNSYSRETWEAWVSHRIRQRFFWPAHPEAAGHRA